MGQCKEEGMRSAAHHDPDKDDVKAIVELPPAKPAILVEYSPRTKEKYAQEAVSDDRETDREEETDEGT